MSTMSFDAFTREAAQVLSRRGSLRTASGAALAAGLNVGVRTEAKQSAAKKVKKKTKKKCDQQREECKAELPKLFSGQPETLARALLCCESCFAGDFLLCFLTL